jgi:hypothetical protein
MFIFLGNITFYSGCPLVRENRKVGGKNIGLRSLGKFREMSREVRENIFFCCENNDYKILCICKHFKKSPGKSEKKSGKLVFEKPLLIVENLNSSTMTIYFQIKRVLP